MRERERERERVGKEEEEKVNISGIIFKTHVSHYAMGNVTPTVTKEIIYKRCSSHMHNNQITQSNRKHN